MYDKIGDNIAVFSTADMLEIQCDTPYSFLWMFKELDMFGDCAVNSCGVWY